MKAYKSYLLVFVILLGTHKSNSQNRGNIWCFGDSAGIDFNSGIPLSIATGLDTRGTCVSISDTNGNLEFYAFTRAATAGNTGLVFNRQHQLMQNGDNILGQAWYNEMIIIPKPDNDSNYYLFSIGVTTGTNTGLFYSEIEISSNNLLGEVNQKNIQLQNFQTTDCLNAIKHGNGRDWWLIFKPATPGSSNNEFWQYLITPSGLSGLLIQSIGSGNSTNSGKITFNPEGNKLVFTNYKGLIEIYDFDRCSGIISNPVTIRMEIISTTGHIVGCEFSSNGNLLYVTETGMLNYLFQFDLTASNILASIDTIWTTSLLTEAVGQVKRGPDGRIYLSGPDTSPIGYIYPYPDTLYTLYNMNLGVINSPDNLGAACDFQPYSFYLGGKRTYWGLPNNPDYDLPALAGSPCDTLVGLAAPPTTIQPPELFVFYQPQWQTTFINAQKLTGFNYRLRVYDIRGKEIISESGKLTPPFYTKNLNCTSFAIGMYIVVLETEKEKLTKKFVIE